MKTISDSTQSVINKILGLSSPLFFPLSNTDNDKSRWAVSMDEVSYARDNLKNILSGLSDHNLQELCQVYLRGKSVWALRNNYTMTKEEIGCMLSFPKDKDGTLSMPQEREKVIDLLLAAAPCVPRYLNVGVENIRQG